MTEENLEYDASDPNHVAQAQKKAKTKKLMIKDGLRSLLSTKNGRAWLWDLMSELGPFQTSFTSSDPMTVAYNTGRKDVGLKLLATLTTPENIGWFVKMMEEANGR